jgi:hypothetical protein
MSASQIAVILFGIVAIAESTWGLSAPERLRAAVKAAFADAPDRNPAVGAFFAALAIGLWLLMSPDQTACDYAVLVLSWIFAGGAIANFKDRGFHTVINFLILRRSTRGIRILYACEFAAACLLIWLGVSGA